jgi:hypothetical protein
VNGLAHRGHADHGPEDIGLGELALDRDCKMMMIQCRNDMSTTFFLV